MRRADIGLPRVIAALEAAGQASPVPADAGADPIFRSAAIGEVPLPRRINSAVLGALFEQHGLAQIVLTRRSADLSTHQGQVSFPGGRLDEGEDAVAAALREAFEEVALDPALVRVVGWLHPVLTMVSSSFIQPVLGTLAELPALTPNPGEVERIFSVSLGELAHPAVFHEERWRIPGRTIPGSEDDSFPVWFFEVSGELIWGATARMLYELLRVVLVEAAGV
jgi:8-oxo-dGTP pyrophosphatase MutT (NUDIX family)